MTHTLVENKVMRQLLDTLQELADDLAMELGAKHAHRERYPGVMQSYTRDMAPVVAARLLLQQMRDEC